MRTLALCPDVGFIIVINFGLVKDSFPRPTVKVKPFGFLAKTFFFQLNFNGKKLFAGNLDTSRPAHEMAIAPRLLICCLSQSLSHSVKYILHNITPKENRKKKAHSIRKAGRDVRFFIKNTTRGTRVEIFNKTRRAWTWQTWTPTYLCFSFLVFCSAMLLSKECLFMCSMLVPRVGRRAAI